MTTVSGYARQTQEFSRMHGASIPLNLAGEFKATVTSTSGTFTTAKLHVTQSKFKCILSYSSSSSLGLIALNLNNINPDQHNSDVKQIIDKLTKLFQGTGNLKNQEVKLEIGPTVNPVVQPSRKILNSMKSKANKKLAEMRDEKITDI